MRIFVVSKNDQPDQCWRTAPKVAVILQEPKSNSVPYGYNIAGMVLISSPTQLDAMAAFNEVCGLSAQACEELHITPQVIADIGKQASPDVTVEPGQTVYANLLRVPGVMSPNELRGVYSYPPESDPQMQTVPLTVFNTLDDYFDAQTRAKVTAEIAAISPATRKFLGLRNLR